MTEIARDALIVAVADYSDRKLRRLRAPAVDAERLAKVLRDPSVGDFLVKVASDVREGELRRRLAQFFANRRPDDLLLVHFSCHGIKDESGELYLAAADTESDVLAATGVASAWLSDQIGRCRSKRIVVLLDCCFSGSFPFGSRTRAVEQVNIQDHLGGHGRAVITASNSIEFAYEDDELTGIGQPSFFTGAVVEALESGKADRDGDGLISVDELYDYVYDRVRECTPNQSPTILKRLEGPLYIARSSYQPPIEPTALPRELLALIANRFTGARLVAVEELANLLKSSDPRLIVAARDALESMLGDESRSVSTRAAQALDVGQDATTLESSRFPPEAEVAETPPAVHDLASAPKSKASTPSAEAEAPGVDAHRRRAERSHDPALLAADRTELLAPTDMASARQLGEHTRADRRRESAAEPGSETARRVSSLPRALLATCLGVVAAAIVGAAVIAASSGGGTTVANAQVTLTPVRGWRSAASSPDSNLIARPVTLRDGSATLSAGLLVQPDAVPGGPPPALVALLGKPASPEATSLDGQPAHRYTWNTAGSQVIALVLASWESDLTLVCRAPAAAMQQCLKVAQGAHLKLRIEQPGANGTLTAALAHLQSSLLTSRAGAQALYGRDPIAQATAARTVAAGDRTAAATLVELRVPPRNRQTIAGVLAALSADTSAYESVASALHRRQLSSYRNALNEVSASGSGLSSALGRLAAQGLGRITLVPRPMTPSLSVSRDTRRSQTPASSRSSQSTAATGEASRTAETHSNTTGGSGKSSTPVQRHQPKKPSPSKLQESESVEGTSK